MASDAALATTIEGCAQPCNGAMRCFCKLQLLAQTPPPLPSPHTPRPLLSLQTLYRCVPVVGIGDHAVPVEDSADVLLRPVPIGELAVDEAASSSIQGPGVSLMVPRGQQG